MAIEIKNLSGKVIHVVEGDTLVRADLAGANLHGAYLQKADLQEANLQKAYLHRAYLQKADLQEANLQKANFQGANLQEANLQKANLQNANLAGADFEWANLHGAYLAGADFEWANLHGAYLAGADLQEANLQKAYLQGADLKGANLQKANLQKANLESANLAGADFRGAFIGSADFTGARNIDKAKGLEGVTTGRVASQLEQEWGPTLKTATLTLDDIRQAVLLEEQELCKQFRDDVVKYLLRYAPKLSWGGAAKTHWDAVRGTFSISGILPEPNKDLRDLRVLWLVPKVFYRFNAKGDTRIAVVGEDGNGKYIDVSFDSTVPAVGQRLLKAIQKMLERDE